MENLIPEIKAVAAMAAMIFALGLAVRLMYSPKINTPSIAIAVFVLLVVGSWLALAAEFLMERLAFESGHYYLAKGSGIVAGLVLHLLIAVLSRRFHKG